MNYKPGTKIKFDRRFKGIVEVGNYQRHYRKVAKQHTPVWFKLLVILTIFTGLWGLCEDANRVQARPEVVSEAQEEPSSTRPLERDTVAREADRQPTIDDWFDKYFGADAKIARAICQSESGLKADSMNKTLNKDGSWDIGTCQINLQAHWDKIPGDTKDDKVHWLTMPELNIAVAKLVYDSQGWTAWTDYKNKRYLKNL